MSADPKRINQDEAISDLYARVRALERARRAGTEYCYWGGTNADTIPASGAHTWDGVDLVTNAESVFSIGTRGGLHGISIDEGGFYLSFNSLLNPDFGAVATADIEISNAVGPINANFIMGSANRSYFGNTWRADLWAIPEGGLGAGNAILFSAVNNELVASTNARAFRVVIRLDASLYNIIF